MDGRVNNFNYYTITGAMFLICDVNEYRKAMKEFKVSWEGIAELVNSAVSV